jgi:hypothetical protein
VVRLKTLVVVFENDLCQSCGEHKWMGQIFQDNQSPRIAIACECDPELNAWIGGIARLPSCEHIVCLDQTAIEFVEELSNAVGREKLHIRRR